MILVRTACIALALAGAAAASSSSPASQAHGADGAAVKKLCTDVMTPKESGETVAKQIDGLCDCTLSGINAFGETEATRRFYRLWAIFAARRAELNALPEDQQEEAASGVLAEVYGDAERGRQEMRAYGQTAMRVADICTAGYAASGSAPPEFSAMGFLFGYSEP